MTPTRLLCYENAPDFLFTESKEKLELLFPDFAFDYAANEPILLFFLSGGSERFALEVAKKENFYLLLASEGNNAFAAATEVKARFDQMGIDCLLADTGNESDLQKVKKYLHIFSKVEQLSGQKLGQIGNVSDWLVASGIDQTLLENNFGIIVKQIDWHNMPAVEQQPADNEFLEKFRHHTGFDITEASRVSTALQKAIDEYNLDAITVECFPMVQKKGITACLALSHLNDLSLPAGCEGDFTSIVGMMLAKAITGTIPWMANLIKVSDHSVRLAHCTAPTQLLANFTIDTHFETGKGTAIAGEFSGTEVTIFRLNHLLNRMFLTKGKIILKQASPQNACRTLIEVSIPEEMATLLKEQPLGNHHLVLPGDQTEMLSYAARGKGIKINTKTE